MSNILRYESWLNENLINEQGDLYIDWRGKLSGSFPKLGLAGEGQRIIGIGAKSGKDGVVAISFGAFALLSIHMGQAITFILNNVYLFFNNVLCIYN